MSLGMFIAWRAQLAKQKHCERCGLYYDKSLEKCSHCSELSDDEVISFKEQQKATRQRNSRVGKYFVLIAVVLAGLLFLSFL